MNATVNIVYRTPPGMQFLSAEAEANYIAEVERARAAQTVRFAVAPRQSLSTRTRTLGAGEEVTLEDFYQVVDQHGAVVFTPLDRLRRLVLEGIVLERE